MVIAVNTVLKTVIYSIKSTVYVVSMCVPLTFYAIRKVLDLPWRNATGPVHNCKADCIVKTNGDMEHCHTDQ